jgi:predicted Zn-dependent protease
METQTELIERNLSVTRVSCKYSRVKAIEQQTFRGRAARAVAYGKVGHASTTDGLTNHQLIERAIETAQVDAPANLIFPGVVTANATSDSTLMQLTEIDLRDLARQMMRTIKRNQPDIAIELELRRLHESVEVHNSNGGEAQLTRTWLEGEAWVERHAGDDVLVALDNFSTAQLDDTPFDFARRMARRLRWANKPIEPQPGPQAVIFSPTAFASLLQPMLWAFNGAHAPASNSRASKRRTGFATKIGKAVFDPQFSLYDDATLPHRPHSAAVDHEGMATRRTALVEHGVVTGFYHNLISAAQAETTSTGNGYRDLIDPPLPSPTNVRVAGGALRLSDMLKNVERGLLIDLIGDSDSSIGLNGDFSRTIVLAYQIERGKVAGYVRGAGVSGDLYKSLRQIEALSCDGYWSGDVFAPYIQLGGATVTA